MKPFVILGHPNDLHAHYVAWALETAGYRPVFINSSHNNCPTGTTLYIDNTSDDFTGADWSDVQAVWCRRLGPPPVFDRSHSEDEYVVSEERRFTKWLIQMLERSAVRWINQPTASQAAENKFIQLQSARSCGIDIPRTLITTRPDRFRAFLWTEGVIVAKPLDSQTWTNEFGETVSAFASMLDLERGSQLSDEDIAQCVTMYQERIRKIADVRMVVLGADVFAYKIIQQGEQHFDFRVGFYKANHLRYQEIPIPARLKTRMLALMDLLRINFASADFTLKENGEWIFLDLNPNGQWLFLEEGCPESGLGQKFCSFFVDGRVDDTTGKRFPSFAEYSESDAGRSLREAFQNALAQKSNSAKKMYG
jgi:glutathione synthase/RimK-type ligase-like ATP-grasp enzyme